MESGVILCGMLVSLASKRGRSFVSDCTRAGEGLLTDSQLRNKYKISPSTWINLTKNTALVHTVRAEHEKRVLNGTATREAADRRSAKTP